MLEFQWQTGERAGEIDTNTEANVNSAIHKFQIYRKGAGKEVVSHVNVDDLPIMEKIDTLYTRQTEIFERFDEVTDMLGQQQEAIVSLSEQLARMVDHHGLLLKQQETLNKLIEKM
jgi:hypothetical protein